MLYSDWLHCPQDAPDRAQPDSAREKSQGTSTRRRGLQENGQGPQTQALQQHQRIQRGEVMEMFERKHINYSNDITFQLLNKRINKSLMITNSRCSWAAHRRTGCWWRCAARCVTTPWASTAPSSASRPSGTSTAPTDSSTSTRRSGRVYDGNWVLFRIIFNFLLLIWYRIIVFGSVFNGQPLWWNSINFLQL